MLGALPPRAGWSTSQTQTIVLITVKTEMISTSNSSASRTDRPIQHHESWPLQFVHVIGTTVDAVQPH